MSNFKLYIATEQRTYPSFDLTAVPGFVYDFGTIPVPLDGRWATSAGPATGVFDNTVDVMVGNVINQSGGYVYTTSGSPTVGNFAPPMLCYDLAGNTYGCVGSGNPGTWVLLISGAPGSFASTFAPVAGTAFVGGAGFDLTGSADSSTAFQAMVTAASAAAAPGSYVSVVIPAQAKIKVGGIVPKSNVAIVSQGGALVSNGDSQGIITNRTAQLAIDNFRVQGVEFIGEGQGVGTTSERRGAIHIYNGSNIRIRDCYAHDLNYHGFAISAGQNIWIENNRLENLCSFGSLNGIHVGMQLTGTGNSTAPRATSSVRITGNIVRNCTTAPVCVQVSTHQSEVTGPLLDFDAVIADNPYLEAVSTSAGGFAAIALEIARFITSDTSQGNKMSKVSVHDNHCKVIGTAPTGGTHVYGVSVSDNNGSNGAQSTDWDEFCDVLVHHNTIDSIDGFILCQASRAIIDHNTGTAKLGGILVANNGNASHTPEQILIDANIISLDATTATGGAITALHTAHTTIQNNRITFTGTPTDGQTPVSNGIYGISATNLLIYGNTVRGATRHGIHLLTVTNYAVDRNRIFNSSSGLTNGYNGLYVDSTVGDTVTKGSIRHNEFMDDRTAGTSNMMASGIGLNAGTPRAVIMGNRIIGHRTSLISGPGSAYWIAQNDFGGLHPFTPVTLTVGSSPYTYTAGVSSSAPYPQEVTVQGGTVTKIEKKRGSATAIDTGVTQGIFRLEASDGLVVTYSSAPTMKSIPAV